MSSYASTHRQRLEAQRAPMDRRLGATAAPPLSSVIASTPSCFDGRKIAAVDRGITSLDSLPERYAGVKTLYVSKNSLRSLAGVEQFLELRALSAADNLLADLDELRRLPAAGIVLEAACFEGNPIAALPNYRAHAIHTLGPALAMLDNRAVTPEERGAAAGAVAHEATLLALMVANACLVHKLGRAVQLVKLHAELQCAVLGGRRGTAAAVAEGECMLGAGRGISRVLQWWDYEGGLGRQERHAIGLAIRREVGRRHRAIVLGGGRPEGSTKLWQQAFAQVMLLQQETIASLMRVLEEAKAEAASTLASLTRPPSPIKRRTLEAEAEAAERLRRDREVLIQELRDAFLSAAGAPPAGGALPQWEARIRELHAALEAAGDLGLATAMPQVPQQQQSKPQQLQRPQAAKAAGHEEVRGQWAITAVHSAAAGAEPVAAAGATTPRQVGISRIKSALKPLRPSSTGTGWSPAKPNVRVSTPLTAQLGGYSGGAAGGSPNPVLRPASARPVHGGAQAAPLQQPVGSPPGQQRRLWQADDGLADYEQGEQARCKTPRPFQPSSEVPHWDGGSSSATSPAREPSRPQLQPAANGYTAGLAQQQPLPPPPQQQQQVYDTAAPHAVPLPGSRSGSPQRSRPGSPGAAPQWTPNPLARHSTAGGGGSSCPGSPGSPQQGLQGVFRLLEREGRLNQVEALRSAVATYEVTAAELQATNLELSEALQQAHQHVCSAEARLAEQRTAAEAAEGEAAVALQGRGQQLEEISAKLEEVLAGRLALQAQLEAAIGERQQLEEAAVAKQAAAAAVAQQLQARIVELEARPPMRLSLTVSHEAEWRAEAVRAAALEARATELQATLSAHQRQARLEAACSRLAGSVLLRRALLWWRDAAAEHAYLGALRQAAAAHYRRTLLTNWLAVWRLAGQRSKLLAAREQGRQQRRLAMAWDSWRLFCQDRVLRRGLDAAAGMHRQSALLAQAFDSWRQRTAACRQLELPPQHPLMQAAAELQRRRLLSSHLGAWRRHYLEDVLPRMAAVQVRLLEQFMGAQRRALLGWQQYIEHRRERRLHKEVARQHYLRQLLGCWRAAAVESKEERAVALRGAITSQLLLLRRGCWAWRTAVEEERRQAAGLELAQQHDRRKLLVSAWLGWGKWTLACHGMGQRHAARLLGTALLAWRSAAKSAEKRRAAEAFHQRSCQRRFHATLRAWHEAAATRRRRRGQQARAATLLQRRLLCRVVACWRRTALAGKLCHTLAVVRELQAAVERVSEELQHKSKQIDTLQSVRVTVEGTSEQLSLQVSSLDSDLAAAQQQAAALEATAHAAQQELQQALAAKTAAEVACAAAHAASAAAVAERDATSTVREQAETDRVAACAAQQAAEQHAAEASATAAAAATAAAEAMAQAGTAAAALDSLTSEHAVLAAQLAAVQQERQALAADLEHALGQAANASERLERLTKEHDRLRRQHEVAQQGAAAGEADQQAARKQAERLARLYEAERESCRALQQQVAQMQAALCSQAALQEELARLADRNQALQRDNASMHSQLERFATVVQQAEGDQGALQTAADALRAEQQQLVEQNAEAAAEAAQLACLADSLRVAKLALEQRLAEALAMAEQAGAERQGLAAAVEALQGERDGLTATAQQLQAEKAGLEAAVARLRDQLQQSNGVLESCRQMLGECCSARSIAADETLSLQELLRSVKAELLLKDAAIRALNRENAQRAERLLALQAHVDALSQQVAAAQQQPSSSHSGGSQARAALAYAQHLWASPLTAATLATPGAAISSASSSLASGERGGGMPQPVSPVAGLFASPATSFIPLPTSQQHPATSATSSPASSSSRVPGGSPARSGAGAAPAAPSPQLHASPATMSALAAGLSDQRLSYLLELVVQKRLSAAQAQQVINSAAEGDARPLLHVLDAVKRQVDGRGSGGASPVPALAPVAAGSAAGTRMASPGTAAELAAVRQEIAELQQRAAA